MAAHELAVAHARLHRDAILGRIRTTLGAATPEWLATLPSSTDGDPEAALASFQARHGRALPAARLAPADARLLFAAGLIEDDVRFGSLFAALQEPLPSRRPCVGLLSWLLADPELDPADLMERAQALANQGMLTITNREDPRSEWVPRLPVAIWDLLHRGRIVPASLPPTLRHFPAGEFPDLSDVVVTGELADAAKRLPDLVVDSGISAVILRGMQGSGRRTLLGAVAKQLGMDLLVHDGQPGDEGWQVLGPLAELGDALPVVTARPGPGETLSLGELPGMARTLGVILGRSGGVSGAPTHRAVSYELGPAGPAQRMALWAQAAQAQPEDFSDIVGSFLLTPGVIARAGRLATAGAAADGRNGITPTDVRSACRGLARHSLETLATRLSPLERAEPPVLGAAASAELDTLLARCRHREGLADGDSMIGGTANRGVRALFTGPSGTGKTLTARYLGQQLNLDVYRVDLAAVVNKYIGETERNLDTVLARAEELHVLVLLDEGDSMLARRSEVNNANDRYANLETNFLLQRLETFEGIVVITTNAGNRIDPAFGRRIDVTVDFPPPDADLRWRLWRAHLPSDSNADPELLAVVARRCVLTGGQIRNACVHASLLSLQFGVPIGDAELMAALAREYRRMGAAFPMDPEAGR